MGEGRLQCLVIDAAALLLVRSALAAILRRSPAAGAGAGATSRPPAAAAARAVALGVGVVACNHLLQKIGLIDRYGQDPHDKTEPTGELLGPSGSGLRAQHLTATLGPLAAAWLLWVVLDGWLRRRQREAAAAEASSSGSSLRLSVAVACGRVAQASAFLQHVAIAAFWWAQLTGGGDLSVGSLFPRLSSGLITSAPALAGPLAAWLRLPARLLLPRVVYLLALLPLGAALLAAAASSLAGSSGSGGGSSRTAAAARSAMWLVASSSGCVTILLGYKGPASLLLAVLEVTCLLGLLAVRQAARRGGSRPGGGKGSPDAGALLAFLEWPSGIAGCGGQQAGDDFAPLTAFFLGMFGLQLFFCSGHFCEFSGLQYASSFVGFEEMAPMVSGPLLLLNTFGLPMAACLALPAAVAVGALGGGGTAAGGDGSGAAGAATVATPARTTRARAAAAAAAATNGIRDGADGGASDRMLQGSLLLVSGARAAALAVCVASAAVQQGHILLWAIFAPKLVFEMWLCACADVCLLLAAWVWSAFAA
jgi:hypothetical protein